MAINSNKSIMLLKRFSRAIKTPCRMDSIHFLLLIQAVCLVFVYLLFIIVLLLGFLNKEGKNCINQKITIWFFIKTESLKKVERLPDISGSCLRDPLTSRLVFGYEILFIRLIIILWKPKRKENVSNYLLGF